MKFSAFAATTLISLIALSSCSPMHKGHGNDIDPDTLAELKIGQDTRDSVRDRLGPPTSPGVFNDDAVYYIAQHTEQRAFLNPQIVKRQVIKMSFNENGVLQRIEELTEKDGENVELVTRESPTVGKDLTVLQQMLGNVGKFKSNNKKKPGHI